MTTHTKGIILRYFKYGENSVIAHIYTRHFGKQSFIFRGAKSRKSKQKINFLQPLFLLDIPISYRENKDLYTGNGATIYYPFQSIPFDYTKNAVAFFLAEFLSKTLHTQEEDSSLFAFLVDAILKLDSETTKSENFHLHFLVKLTHQLGIQPSTNYSSDTPFLSITHGKYISNEESYSFDKEYSRIFYSLQTDNWNKNTELPFSRIQRNKLLTKILNYYTYHFNELKNLKSLSVLNELFI